MRLSSDSTRLFPMMSVDPITSKAYRKMHTNHIECIEPMKKKNDTRETTIKRVSNRNKMHNIVCTESEKGILSGQVHWY